MDIQRPESALSWEAVEPGDKIVVYVPGIPDTRRVVTILNKPDISISREVILVEFRDENDGEIHEREACELGLLPRSDGTYAFAAIPYDEN